MKLKAVWDLLRLDHGIMYGVGVIVGAYVSSKSAPLDVIILGFLTAFFLQASAFALNDYIDYEVDLRNNRLDRPLVRGDLKRSDALLLSVILAPPGFAASYLIGFKAFLFAVLITVLGYLYNIKLKEYGILGNFYIALSMAAPFIFGGIISTGFINKTILILSVLAFLAGTAREIMKGIEDVRGDVLRDVKSVARVKGIKFTSRLASIIFILVLPVSFLPFFLIGEYMLDLKYIAPVILADLILAKAALDLYSGKVEAKDIRKMRKNTMLAFALGLVGFIYGMF